jgi:endonuclease/exonuclease/phosphatase (EEP) superfamily protein YafD
LNTLPLLPYLSAQPAAAATTLSINLASINLLSRNKEAQPLLSLLSAEQPDVIVLQEFTPQWAELTATLADRYPYQLLEPRQGNFGIALLSVYPLVKEETFELLAPEFPAIKAILQVGSTQLGVIGVHPVAPISRKRTLLRNAQLAALAALADKAEGPLVLLGDLNTSPWSPYFQRLLADGGLRNGAEGFGLDITWPTFMPLLGIPIDYCLVSPELRVTAQRRGSRIGSDHYPLFTEVALTP